MPIYDYKCSACGNEFEAIVLPWLKKTAECPSCHSQALDQLPSAFAVQSEEKSKAAWQAAQKKFERTELRDKRIAEREEMEHHHH